MRLAALILAALMASLSQAETLSFGLFGDTPYNHWERQHLPDLIAEMDSNDLAFVIHDGDIKSGSSECSDAAFLDILGVFQNSKHPLIYVPGDNEWTDCHRRSNGGYEPMERLTKLRELFFAGPDSLGRRTIPLTRQSHDPAFAAYRENVRWEAGGVLFLGLNVPGSSNNFHGNRLFGGPSSEFLDRSAANRAWLRQAFALARQKKMRGILIVVQGNPGFHTASTVSADPGYSELITQLIDNVKNFDGQVAFVHGDTHQQRIDTPLRDPATGERLSNFVRVETYGSPSFGWIHATVDSTDPKVFRFEPRRFQPKN